MDATWDTPFSRIAKDIYARQFNSAFHAVKAEGIAAPSTPASQTNDMSTFKYGTSCDPLRRTSIRDLNPHWEEGSVVDNEDPDRPVQCPFDKNHVIRACRFAYHIQKCEKNNPAMAAEMVICPFNAQHRMLKYEMDQHMRKCIDRQTEKSTDVGFREVLPKFKVPVNRFATSQSEEDWETEADDTVDPFIWDTSATLMPQNRPTPFCISQPVAPKPPSNGCLPWKM
ncbi:gametocyte-specific factor 1-like isoform X2 [Engraulis encrasicolus]